MKGKLLWNRPGCRPRQFHQGSHAAGPTRCPKALLLSRPAAPGPGPLLGCEHPLIHAIFPGNRSRVSRPFSLVKIPNFVAALPLPSPPASDVSMPR